MEIEMSNKIGEENREEEASRVLHSLVMALTAKLGRLPTEEELIDFINGNDETRLMIWNTQ